MTPFLIFGGLFLLVIFLFWIEWEGTACLLGIATVLGTVVYFTPPPDPNSVDYRLDHGQAILSSTAPDGTKLWHVHRGGRDVYYSTAGTHTTHTENCGKHCTRTVDDDVSNAQ
jgi:hypothetical protein